MREPPGFLQEPRTTAGETTESPRESRLARGLAGASLALAILPAAIAALNWRALRPPPELDGSHEATTFDSTTFDSPTRPGHGELPRVSILIPARNEQANIERAVRSALESRGVAVEVRVMDDHSTDRTTEIVRRLAASDDRVRLDAAPALPEGWAGKQHACQRLAERAEAPVLLFVDADVVLEPDAAARAVAFLDASGADLASGFPRQITATPTEGLLLPFILVLLIGYLPLHGMRAVRLPGFGAGCGQFFVARRTAYRAAGGHAAIRTSFHDGIALPRAFRRADLSTDLFDATELASCRMYRGGREVVAGLAKNAHEGMGGPVGIWIWSALLLGGHVLPPVLAVVGSRRAPGAGWTRRARLATLLGWLLRLSLARRFRQPVWSAAAHPLGAASLVAVQWYARWRRGSGRAVGWKDRAPVDPS